MSFSGQLWTSATRNCFSGSDVLFPAVAQGLCALVISALPCGHDPAKEPHAFLEYHLSFNQALDVGAARWIALPKMVSRRPEGGARTATLTPPRPVAYHPCRTMSTPPPAGWDRHILGDPLAARRFYQ
jgi:hypothetical protein